MRQLLAVLLAIACSAGFSYALAEPTRLSWDDLLPEDARGSIPKSFRGIVQHNQIVAGNPLLSAREPSSKDPRPVNSGKPRLELAGRNVTLSGYIVPLRKQGDKYTSVLLVPYLGACIHIPAPPANQVVLVTSKSGIEPDTVLMSLLDPVTVAGVLSVGPTDTALGIAGYELDAKQIQANELLR